MSKMINQTINRLQFDPPLGRRTNVKDLRGAVACLYPDKQLLHQHCDDGSLTYNHPLIQYKIISQECLIIGFNEGADLLPELRLLEKILTLGNSDHKIITSEFQFSKVFFGITDCPLFYTFLTSWLALNEKNYDKYKSLGNVGARKNLLEKILIGNIISISKSLSYTVPGPIKADFISFREVSSTLKGTPMIGFMGKFSVNFSIPDYWGLGKSVSRGFGAIVRKGGPH